jgi:hypothetical protein
MSDPVVIALIVASPGILASCISILNFFKLGKVSSNVDGNLSEIKEQLAKVTAERLTLTEQASHADGVKEEKERKKKP